MAFSLKEGSSVMGKRVGFLSIAAALLLSPAVFTPAFAQNVGDPCTGTDRQYTVSGPSSSILICNGSTLELLGKDLSNPVRKGVGTAAPAATLDVAGEAKIGNTSLACSATTEGAMRYNSTSKEMEYCNGTAWGSLAPATGGGSSLSYAGLTPSAYSGLGVGGIAGANAKCNAAFPGSRIMNMEEVIWLASSMSTTSGGWVFSPNFPGGGCSGFSTSGSTIYGLVITGTAAATIACNTTYQINCVKD